MSIIDFTQYQVPDVYVQQQASPLVNVIGLNPNVIALVGPTRGFKVKTDALLLTATTAVNLSQLGADPTSVVLQDASGTTYSGADFLAVIVPGSPDVPHQQVTVARSPTSNLPSGTVGYVTYNYTDPNFFTPQTYSNFEDVKAAYGEPLNLNTSAIVSPLSMAAQVAFTNGANQVVVLPTTDIGLVATRFGLSAAYVKLGALPQIGIVVPLPVGMIGVPGAVGDIINVGTDLKAHVESMSNMGLFRTGIVGYEVLATVAPDVIAQGIGSARVMEAWPNALNYFNGTTNQTFIVSGYYLAAAYAGRLASQVVQMPLTKKRVLGFSGIPNSVFQTMTLPYKNQLSAAGVAVTEPQSGQASNLVIRHGVTTLGTSVMTREISLVRAADAMIQLIHDTLSGGGLIGSPTTPNTTATVKSVIQGVLDSLITQGVIVAYSGLGVQQQTTNPTVIAVRFAYSPSYPLNYISVIFSIDTTTGGLAPVTQGQGTGGS